MTVLERLTAPGPKRILALDGGGVRGMLTIGFLERLESLLRERHQRPDYRLCDYFDLIGGTSVGSTLAAGLAVGMEVAELGELAMDMLENLFGRRRWKFWQSIFSSAPLRAVLADITQGRTLDDPFIQTGLCIVTKRADTRSTWPVTNHPNARYFEHNRGIKLQDLVYASAAAPIFFEPTGVEVGEGEMGAFVDGGVSMSNNPALQLFLMATLEGYPFHWERGEDNLLLVSIGTGRFERRDRVEKVLGKRTWDWTHEVPTMMIEDSSTWNQLLLQLLSRSPTPWKIDEEVGDLRGELIPDEPALRYLRYDAPMNPTSLAEIGFSEAARRMGRLYNMTRYENREVLRDIGRGFAGLQVKSEHFPVGFDRSAASGAPRS